MTNTKKIENDFKKIKEALPYGSIKIIAKKVGLSRGAVSSVLDGKWKNQRIVEAALELLIESKNQSKELQEKIKEVLL